MNYHSSFAKSNCIVVCRYRGVFDVFAEESRKIREGKDQELVISLEHMTLRNSNPCHRVRNEFSRAISFNIYENALIMFQIQFVLVEDIKMNDGSAEKPYFMSDSLKGILDLQNRPPPEGNDEGRKWANGLHPKTFQLSGYFLVSSLLLYENNNPESIF